MGRSAYGQAGLSPAGAEGLLRDFLAGDRRACARLITLAEEGNGAFPALYDRIFGKVGAAARTGFTGPPGSGKSTLVDRFIEQARSRGRTVGVVAVDPTSPFTGGALLGDRIRMKAAVQDEGVFVRSMATRGSLGGLSRAAVEACDVLDAFGCAEVFVETVGVGQAEHDVVSATDTVLVVLQPGAGDGVQALKAGLMEIADLFAVNKADLPGAEGLAADLAAALELAAPRAAWRPPVLRVSAASGAGVGELFEAVERHRAFLRAGEALGETRRRKRVEHLRRVAEEGMRAMIFDEKGYGRAIARALDGGGSGPYAVVGEFLGRLRSSLPEAPTERGSR